MIEGWVKQKLISSIETLHSFAILSISLHFSIHIIIIKHAYKISILRKTTFVWEVHADANDSAVCLSIAWIFIDFIRLKWILFECPSDELIYQLIELLLMSLSIIIIQFNWIAQKKKFNLKHQSNAILIAINFNDYEKSRACWNFALDE